MRKQMIEATAFEVAHQVRTVEDTIDTALEEIAELQARMMRARAAAGIGIRTGHEALEQLCQATTALVAASRIGEPDVPWIGLQPGKL